MNWYDHHARQYDAEIGRWSAIDPALQAASPYMAMGNSPMMYVDADGRTWFKKIGKFLKKGWDSFWGAANDFAQWADANGVPSAGVGYNNAQGSYHYMGDSGNVYHNQYGNNYEGKVDQAVFDARGDYFSQQANNASHDQMVTNNIMPVASNGGGRMPTLEGVSIDLLTGAFKDYIPINGVSISLLRDSRDYIGISLTFNMNGQGIEGTLLGVNTVNGYRLNGKPLNIEDTFGNGNVTSYGALFGSYSSSSNAYYDYYGPEQFRVNSYGISAGSPGAHANYETYTIGFSIPSFPALLDRWTNF